VTQLAVQPSASSDEFGTPRPSHAARAGAEVAAVDEEQFSQDISLMLKSGLTLLDSLKTLRERAEPRKGRTLDRLMRLLREGDSLSVAMNACGGFKPGLLACVRSSELTGDLSESLHRYAQNAARLRKMRSQMASALVYPVLLISVATLVVLFLLMYVVPRFAAILEGSGHDLPAMSRLLIAVGRGLGAVPLAGWVAMAALAAFGIWRVVAAAREGRLEALLSEWATHVPGIRELVLTFSHAQLARSAGMLVASGVPVLKALAMCRELLLAQDRVRLDRALASASSGAPLASALHDHGLIDTLGLRVLRVSEQTGQIHAALDRLADIHDQDVERALERAGRLIEPILMLGIGLVVGGIVVLMYLPIFQLAASVG
jgi:general secretion pathway protein F